MSAETVLAVVGSGGVGAVLVAIITGLFSKRRLSAEATEIITKAASAVVDNLRADNTAVRGEASELRLRVDVLERRQDAWGRVLVLHAAWDREVVSRLSDCDINLPDPPPLRPLD